jgi:hypothetical protein
VARLGEKRNTCKVLTGKPKGKTLLERLKRRWEDNIKIGLRFWTALILFRVGTSDALVGHGNTTQGSIKCREFLDQSTKHPYQGLLSMQLVAHSWI